MRVRCSFCGAEYDAPVTRAALVLVYRCERCGRARLKPVDPAALEDEPDDDPPATQAHDGPRRRRRLRSDG
jgi:DNA-directed RNA polymerase subunit RPC12/RpoP